MSDEHLTQYTSCADDTSRLPTATGDDMPVEVTGAAHNLTGVSDSVDESTNNDLVEEPNGPVPESEPETAALLIDNEDESLSPEPDVDQIPDPQLQDIEAVRKLIHSLHPSIVPELINGDSVSALIASIKPAEDAYNRIVTGMHIPAGGNSPVSDDGDSLPSFDKIRRGLSAQSQRGK